MKIGHALSIFSQIDSEEYTTEEKGAAIYKVVKMETHNSVSKAQMLSALRFLLHLAFDIPEEADARTIPRSPYPDGEIHILACPHCGSGEYLHNEDGNQNAYCGQCGQAIEWKEAGA